MLYKRERQAVRKQQRVLNPKVCLSPSLNKRKFTSLMGTMQLMAVSTRISTTAAQCVKRLDSRLYGAPVTDNVQMHTSAFPQNPECRHKSAPSHLRTPLPNHHLILNIDKLQRTSAWGRERLQTPCKASSFPFLLRPNARVKQTAGRCNSASRQTLLQPPSPPKPFAHAQARGQGNTAKWQMLQGGGPFQVSSIDQEGRGCQRRQRAGAPRHGKLAGRVSPVLRAATFRHCIAVGNPAAAERRGGGAL